MLSCCGQLQMLLCTGGPVAPATSCASRACLAVTLQKADALLWLSSRIYNHPWHSLLFRLCLHSDVHIDQN
jgi:hypothetical protein